MAIDRQGSLEWFERNRRRSRDLFDRIAPEAYESRPIALRNPICFYEGHLPAFNVNHARQARARRGGDRLRVRGPLRAGHRPGGRVRGDGNALPVAVARGDQAYGERADQRHPGGAAEKGHHPRREPGPSPMASPPTRFSSTSRCTRKPCAICGTASLRAEDPPGRRAEAPDRRALRGRKPSGSPPARRRSERRSRSGPLRVGQRVPGTSRGRARLRNRRSTTSPTRISWSSSSAGGYENRGLWDEEGWEWRSGAGVEHPVFWEWERRE